MTATPPGTHPMNTFYRIRLVWLATFTAAASLFASDARSEPLRHLFLEPAFLREIDKVSLGVNPPQRSEIVIRADKPWEQRMISLFLTVLDDGGKLRMWYICRSKANQPNVAYAESQDGVTWIKPNLGIVDFEGSKENNLVGLSSLEGNVFRDPNAPEAERYGYVTHLIEEGMVRFHSPDGLHWSRDAKPLLTFGSDTQNVTVWDERIGKYVFYLRGWFSGENKLLYRKVVRAETPSLTKPIDVVPSENSRRLWGKDKVAVIDDELPTVFALDDRDSANADVYNLSALRYPPDPRWYVGFPSLLQREGTHRSLGRLETHFTGSGDGITWHRYDRTPYLKPGLADSESQNMTFMGTGLAVRGDEIWQYGIGLHSLHGDRKARDTRTDGTIYRHVQRLDGFVSLDFGDVKGRCVTAPVQIDGSRLLLNVDTGALGQLRAALLDADGKEIPGFGAGDCQVVRGNSTHAVVAWKEGNDLSALLGRDVQLQFTGTRTKLYSFYFASEVP
ncbi:MAG: hypothetical protein C0483_03900 [Pirellula sp.]|nr:hypothetical protein [Pirellula sp.]